MSLQFLEPMLKEITGVSHVFRAHVEHAAQTRMRHLGLDNIANYSNKVRQCERETQALIDELMVSETWFFRDGKPFQFLTDYIGGHWQCSNEKPLRILSAPCATGEEPYSIAMVLLDCGLHPSEFIIDAVDISKRALDYAKRGVFSKRSVRGDEWDMHARYLSEYDNGYRLADTVRHTVNFHHINFWDDNFPGQHYDIIFCRNLLMYFDCRTQQKAVTKLHGMLENQGLLFLGHSETLCITHGQFTSVPSTGTFAFQKTATSPGSPGYQYSHPEPEPPVEPKTSHHITADTPLSSAVTSRHPTSNQPGKADIVEAAHRLIDEGFEQHALLLCHQYTQDEPDDGHGYYLLGLCYTGQNDHEQALQALRKAVQLDPEHYQALLKTACCYDRIGDPELADFYRQQAKRLINYK